MTPTQKKTFRALMVTQIGGAFNDNIYKVLLQLLILAWVHDASKKQQLVALTGAVFVAPFLMFSMIAGRIADRYSKSKVAVATKIWELVVVIAAIASLWLQHIPSMLVTLYVLAMQSTFFSPAKYGILPEIMTEAEISKANGWLNIGTYAAIIGGTVAATWTTTNFVAASILMAIVSLVGLWASHYMHPVPAANPAQPLAWNPLSDLSANWRLMRQDPVLLQSALFVNFFWFVGALLQLNIFLYADAMMNASARMSGILLLPAIIGIGLGSYLGGRWSKEQIELGFVPYGAAGMAIFSIDLLWAHTSLYRVMVDLFMLGMSAGFYEIPLIAMLQWRSPKGERGRILATINLMSFAAILFSSAFLWLLNTPLKLNPAQVFFFQGVVSLASLAALLKTFPESRRRAVDLLRPNRPA